MNKSISKVTWKQIGQLVITNIDKANIGILQKCSKPANTQISRAFSMIFNQSLLEGIVPDALKIAKHHPFC